MSMECANDNNIKLTATIIKKLSRNPKPRNGTALTIITEIKVEIQKEMIAAQKNLDDLGHP